MSNQVTVYVIDSSPAMATPMNGQSDSPCKQASEYVIDKLENRAVFARKTDIVAVYAGSQQVHPFGMPTKSSIIECRELIYSEKSKGAENSILESAHYAMAQLLNWVQRRKPVKRVIVLTNQVQYDEDSSIKLSKRAVADGIDLAFAIVNPIGVEGLDAVNWDDFANAAAEIGRAVKLVQGTSSYKGDLTLGGPEFPQLRIGIQCVSATRTTNPPVAHMVHDGKPVKRVSERKVGDELVPDDEIQEAYAYGSGYVLVDDYIKNRARKNAEPCFEILGFVESLPPWFSLGSMDFVVATSTQSSLMLSALVQALRQSGGLAIARMVNRSGTPELCVLEPLQYAPNTGSIIDCLLKTTIPYADDCRSVDFLKLHNSPEAQGVMDEVVDLMEMTDGPGINGETIENSLNSRIITFIKKKAIDDVDDIPPPPDPPKVELKGDPTSLFDTLVKLLPIESEERPIVKNVEQSILATGGELDIDAILGDNFS